MFKISKVLTKKFHKTLRIKEETEVEMSSKILVKKSFNAF